MSATAEPVAAYVDWPHPSPVLDALDSLRQHPTDPLRTGFTVTDRKINGRQLLHGGVIAVLGDVTIGHGMRTVRAVDQPLLTVNLHCDITGQARIGEWVDIVVSPGHIGRRLASGSATFRRGTRQIATVTALFLAGD
jgi:acyl-coenzyme A thioesterase PaaI-like protein